MNDTVLRDSGLRCPWCEHNLTALCSNRCPECGGVFVVCRPDVMKHVPFRTFGFVWIRCSQCGHNNTSLLPRACQYCGCAFTWFERVFGVSRRKTHDRHCDKIRV